MLDIYSQVGGKQVSAFNLSFEPSRILYDALKAEMSEKWKGDFEIVNEPDVPRDANRIGCNSI